MISSTISKIAVVIAVVGMSVGCANTIRGVGQDTANTVDATQQAGRNIERSAR